MKVLKCPYKIGGGIDLPQSEEANTVYEIESLLRVVATTVRKNGRAILVDFDITPPLFDALLWISKRDPEMTIGELSANLGLAYSTTTDLVDRLEKRGLAERLRDTEDKRVVRLRLLREGRDVIEHVLDARRQYLGEVLERVDHSNRLMLLEALRLLQKQLDQV